MSQDNSIMRECLHLPPAIDNIEQLDCNKLLGVLFQSNFKMDMHVQNMLTQCTQRMYLIKLLKHQGMPQQQLAVITHTIIVSRILYALPACGGFLTVELKIESVPFSSTLSDLVT